MEFSQENSSASLATEQALGQAQEQKKEQEKPLWSLWHRARSTGRASRDLGSSRLLEMFPPGSLLDYMVFPSLTCLGFLTLVSLSHYRFEKYFSQHSPVPFVLSSVG